MMNIKAQMEALIKRAYITQSIPDTGKFPRIEVSYHEKIAIVEHLTPYGVYSNPPKNSTVIIMNVGGQEENRVALANTPFTRFKDLLEGEVVVGNTITQAYVKFDALGNVEINCPGNLTVTATGDGTTAIINAVRSTVNASESASITSPAITLSDGGAAVPLSKYTDLKSYIDGHTHMGVESGPGNSGPPTAALPTGVATQTVKGN